MGFCSDICLEFKFKHMSMKMQLEHEQKIMENWLEYAENAAGEALDCLFIAGNVFSTPKPKNATIHAAMEGIQNLVDGGMEIFIYPGHLDTPLFHATDDYPHVMLGNIKGVHFLAESDNKTEKIIEEAAFNGQIAGNPVEIFTPPVALKNLDEYTLDMRGRDDALTLFVMNGRYKDDLVEDSPVIVDKTVGLHHADLESLWERNVDFLILGGPNPVALKNTVDASRVITAPQLNLIDFNFANNEFGIKITDMEPETMKLSSPRMVSIPRYTMIQKSFNITNIPPRNAHEQILNLLKEYSDRDRMFQLRIVGQMEREGYHALEIFNYQDIGCRKNAYFELRDEIEFQSKAVEISGLDPLDELKQLAQERIMNKKNKKGLILQALECIQQDWNDV